MTPPIFDHTCTNIILKNTHFMVSDDYFELILY